MTEKQVNKPCLSLFSPKMCWIPPKKSIFPTFHCQVCSSCSQKPLSAPGPFAFGRLAELPGPCGEYVKKVSPRHKVILLILLLLHRKYKTYLCCLPPPPDRQTVWNSEICHIQKYQNNCRFVMIKFLLQNITKLNRIPKPTTGAKNCLQILVLFKASYISNKEF